MIQIPLQSVPTQSLSIQLDNNAYNILLRVINSADAQIMAADISINNVLIVSGQRIVGSYPIIPYEYLWNGNFILLTTNDDLPDYNQFQISQYLVYASQAELEALNAGT